MRSFSKRNALYDFNVIEAWGKWSLLDAMFKIIISTFEKLVKRFSSAFVIVLEEVFITQLRDGNRSIGQLERSSRRVLRFLFALYATDVKFYHTDRPLRSHLESRKYFGKKNDLYRYKTDVSVSPHDFAIRASRHHLRSRADITILGALL